MYLPLESTPSQISFASQRLDSNLVATTSTKLQFVCYDFLAYLTFTHHNSVTFLHRLFASIHLTSIDAQQHRTDFIVRWALSTLTLSEISCQDGNDDEIFQKGSFTLNNLFISIMLFLFRTQWKVFISNDLWIQSLRLLINITDTLIQWYTFVSTLWNTQFSWKPIIRRQADAWRIHSWAPPFDTQTTVQCTRFLLIINIFWMR